MSNTQLRTLFLTGVAVIVPLAVSVWVLLALVRFVGSVLAPVGIVLRQNGIQSQTTVVLLQATSLLVIGVLVLIIGAVAQRRIGRQLVDRLDSYLAQLPGIGTVYQTARRMSDLLLNPDSQGDGGQFREVKLVEFPGRNAYTLGFLTTRTPPQGVVQTARTITGNPDESYQTLFLPMAPNPLMGGHLAHIPEERVHDVNLEIEEAIQYILTTGVVDNPRET
ncbi:MAG: DUF502 domain-containing protein [Halobacteriaceae archaeon]